MARKAERAINFCVSGIAEYPLYKQIAEQVKQLIATGRLQPGQHLPPVRRLANSLGVSLGTVMKGYTELGQIGAIQMRRGRGTIVSAKANEPRLLAERQTYLSDMMSNAVLKALSLGYSPAEAEAAFSVHLDRWRDEQKGKGQSVK